MVRSLLLFGALSFFIGAYAAHGVSDGVVVVLLVAVFVLFLLPFFRHSVPLILSFLLLLSGCAGFLRVVVSDTELSSALSSFYGTRVVLTGFVRGDIEERNSGSRYTVSVVAISSSDTSFSFEDSVRVLLRDPHPTLCVSGESAAFTVLLREPLPFMTESGRLFDYPLYLRQHGISAVGSVLETTCRGSTEVFSLFPFLRTQFVHVLHAVFPLEEGSLLGGLLLGLRGALSSETMELFRVTGLIHIVVLSGYNITLVAEAVRKGSRFLGQRISFWLSLVVIFCFVLLSGAQTAAVRAGGMASLALVARAYDRSYDGVLGLFLVAVGMVLYDPLQVLFSTSFHMSFLATLGLLVFATPLERYLSFIPTVFALRSIVAATFATSLTLLPYLAYAIGEISLISFVANILVLPLVPLAMALGAFTITLFFIAPSLALLFAPLATLPLTAILFLAELFAFPYAAIRLPELPVFVPLLCVVLVLFFAFHKVLRVER